MPTCILVPWRKVVQGAVFDIIPQLALCCRQTTGTPASKTFYFPYLMCFDIKNITISIKMVLTTFQIRLFINHICVLSALIWVIIVNVLDDEVVDLARCIIFSCFVYIVDWVVAAVCKHIATEDALAGGDVDVGIDESTDLRIVIPALQVIEAGFLGERLARTLFFPLAGIVSHYPR